MGYQSTWSSAGTQRSTVRQPPGLHNSRGGRFQPTQPADRFRVIDSSDFALDVTILSSPRWPGRYNGATISQHIEVALKSGRERSWEGHLQMFKSLSYPRRCVLYNLGYRIAGSIDGAPFPPSRLINLVIGTSEISWYQLGGMFNAKAFTTLLVSATALRRTRSIPCSTSVADVAASCGGGRA